MNLPDDIAAKLLGYQRECAEKRQRPHYALFGVVVAIAQAPEPAGLRYLAGRTGMTNQGVLNLLVVGKAIGVISEVRVGKRPKYTVPGMVNPVDRPSDNGQVEHTSELTVEDAPAVNGQLSRPLSGANGQVERMPELTVEPVASVDTHARARSNSSLKKVSKKLTKLVETTKSLTEGESEGEIAPSAPARASRSRADRATATPEYRAWLLAFRKRPKGHRLRVRALARLCQWRLRVISDAKRCELENLARSPEIRRAPAEDFTRYGRNHWSDPFYGRNGKCIPPSPKLIGELWARFTAKPTAPKAIPAQDQSGPLPFKEKLRREALIRAEQERLAEQRRRRVNGGEW